MTADNLDSIRKMTDSDIMLLAASTLHELTVRGYCLRCFEAIDTHANPSAPKTCTL